MSEANKPNPQASTASSTCSAAEGRAIDVRKLIADMDCPVCGKHKLCWSGDIPYSQSYSLLPGNRCPIVIMPPLVAEELNQKINQAISEAISDVQPGTGTRSVKLWAANVILVRVRRLSREFRWWRPLHALQNIAARAALLDVALVIKERGPSEQRVSPPDAGDPTAG